MYDILALGGAGLLTLALLIVLTGFLTHGSGIDDE